MSASEARRVRTPFPLGAATLAVGIFALCGASVCLALATAAIPSATLSEFYAHNVLPDEARRRIFAALLAGEAGAAALALGFLAVRGERGALGLRRAADVILPAVLVGLLPSLFAYEPWHGKPLTYLVELVAAVLLLEQWLRRSLAAMPAPVLYNRITDWLISPRVQRVLPVATVLAGCLWYAIYFSYYTLLNHQRLNTAAFDLGINVNWCYNALHGHFWRSTVLFGADGGHFLGNHAIFGMALWLPFYAIKPGADVLLIFQATIAGFAALPLYMFAATQIPRWSAVIVAYAYLFFAPLHGPNFYDYHELIPPLFFHFLLYWAIATRKNWLVAPLVVLLWSFREDVAVGLVVLGVFLAITGIRPRLGLVMAACSCVWFVLIKFVIMPMFWMSWFDSIYKELQPPGRNGYGPVVQTILIDPAYFLTTLLKEEKLVYFLHMFAPLALLPARKPALLLLAIPGFAFSLLTTGYAPTLSISFQYTCHSIPYLFAASVLMLRLLGRDEAGTIRRRAALGAIALGVLSHSYVFGAVLQHHTFVGGFARVEFTMTEDERHRYQTIKKMAALIPQDASVAATENEVPHIAARMNAYTIRTTPVDADYVLVNRWRASGSQSALQSMFANESYGLVMKGYDLYLFARDFKSKDTHTALRDLGLKHGKH